jgi:adenylylsulfate kinase
MNSSKSTNITWHQGEIKRADREELNGHKAAVLWFTGLSGSGKSTLAHAVEARLFQAGCHTIVLDGDNIRHGLNNNLTFSPEDREENIRRLAEVAKLFTDAGLLVLTAFISPYRKDREKARALVDEGRFFEIHVHADIEVCESRDPKGLYKKARAGEIRDFTGISAPYEAPKQPEVIIDTGKDVLEDCAQQVIDVLALKGIIDTSSSPK